MTHPVSSSTESQTLRIGDPEIADWIPVFTGMTKGRYGNDGRGAGMTERKFCVSCEIKN